MTLRRGILFKQSRASDVRSVRETQGFVSVGTLCGCVMIKEYLKNIAAVRRINAAVKAWQMRSQYLSTVGHYSRQSGLPVGDSWRNRAQVIQKSWQDDRLRLFFLGTDEQQDKSGMLQALQAVADVRCFVRKDGSWGQNDPSTYDQRLLLNTSRLEKLFEENCREGWVPDILIGQTWGCLVQPVCFSRLRQRYGVFVINVAMDDRHQYWGARVGGKWDGTFSLIPHIDLTLTSTPEAVAWYRAEGGASFFFPEASDPDIFRPMPDLPKLYDISFVGSRYGIRAELVDALRRAGLSVAAFGSGWEAGRLAAEAVPTIFAQSRIVLGVSAIGHSRDFVGLKLRDFDAPLSGSCYLTQHNPDLEMLYVIGDEIVTYRNSLDCVETVKSLLANPERINAIGHAGRQRALAEHTWEGRFGNMFLSLLTHP